MNQVTINLQPWRHDRRVYTGARRVLALLVWGLVFFGILVVGNKGLLQTQRRLQATLVSERARYLYQQQLQQAKHTLATPPCHQSANLPILALLKRLPERLPVFAQLRQLMITATGASLIIQVQTASQVHELMGGLTGAQLRQASCSKTGYICKVNLPIVSSMSAQT